MKVIDETNNVYGRLKVVGRAHPPRLDNKGLAYWYCECECHTTIMVSGSLLRTGKVRSCGCLRRDMLRQNRGRSREKPYNKQKETAE